MCSILQAGALTKSPFLNVLGWRICMCALAALGTWIFSRFRCSTCFKMMLVRGEKLGNLED